MKNKSLKEKRKEDGYWGYIYMEQHVKEFIEDVFKIVNNVPKINKIKQRAGKELID